MKKGTILTLFTVIFLFISSSLTAQHFSTVWSGNPYQPMSIVVNSATIDNVNCTTGDEIAVFDVDGNGAEICVGVVVLTGEIPSGSPAFITSSTNDPLSSGQDGFIDGHSIIYRIWDSSESTEIIIVNPTYNNSFDIVFTSLGTALLTALDGISAIQTTAGSLTTCQGSVTIPIDVTNLIDVGEFSLILDYGTTNLSYTSYQNANTQLSSGTLTVTENSGEITITWNSSTAANIASGTLIELLFTASTVYSQANESLTWDEPYSYYKDSNGATLQAIYTNGVVTINPIPVDAGSITGTTPICQGTSGESYQVGAITNATSYVWDLTPSTSGTITGSGTTITIDYSGTYSGSATLSVYGSNTCGNGTTSSLPINVIANPTVGAGANATICEDGTFTLAGSATSQQSVLWTTSGDGTFDNATILAATYTPGSNDISGGSVTLTLTSYAITPCSPDVIDDMTLTIQELPTTGAGADATICENNTYTLSGTSSNQQSILWISSGDGTFDDASSLTATYTPGTADISSGSTMLTLTAYATTPCGTNAVDNMTLTIQGLPTANAGSDASICEDVTYTLSGTASNQLSVLWTTSGDGTFDNATLVAATYTPGTGDISSGSTILTLTSYLISPCTTDASDNMTLSIQELPTANSGTDVTLCENNTYTLSGAASSQQSNLWTTAGDGTFDDATLLAATYTPGTADISTGSATLTITAYAITPCGTNATDDITISITLLPLNNAGADDAVCETTPVYTLSGTASNHTSVLWTGGDGTFDDATLLNATYTAGTSDLSTGSVTLTLTAYPDAPCATNAVDDMLLTYAVLPSANAGPDDEICLNTPSYQVTGATATDYNTLLWTTSGDGTFSDATLLNPVYSPGTSDRANGTVDLTLTATSVAPCNDDDTMTLTFAVLPTADAGVDAEICEDNTYQLSGTATDYSALAWTTSGDGSFDDITSLTAIYTPGANDKTSGSVNLTLTAFASFPCVDDDDDIMVLSIELLPIADAGPDDEICLNTPSYYIVNATAANQSSVMWTTAGDGTFDDPTLVNATYNPGINDIANFSVILTITTYASSPCTSDDVDDMLLEFALLPTADAGIDDDICETDSYTLSGSYTNGSSCFWTTSGDGTFNDATLTNATYTPGTNDIVNGTVDLTITAYAQFPCTNDALDVMTLTIIILPSVDAGIDDAICENIASFATTGTTSGNVNSVLWETTGDGTFDDPTILASTYTPGPNDVTNEGVDLILNAYPTAPCVLSVSDTMFLLIQPLPTSNAGDDDGVCENDSYMLNGSGTNYDHVYWTTSGDGVFDDALLLNATYTHGTGDITTGSVNLTMYAYSISPCNGEVSDVMTLTIIDLPDANAGDDGETCEGSSYLLNGMAHDYSSVNWTTEGDGTFDDPALLAATYTPGTIDISNGTVDLTLTASPISPCVNDASDDMTLSIINDPEQPLTPDGPLAIDLDATQSSEYTTEVMNITSCQWYLEPIEAGTIEGDDIIGIVYWNSDFVGISAYIHVVAINDCGESTSDTISISVSPVGINHLNGNEPQINISPNPSLGKFNISIEGATDDIDLIIINSSGQPIHKAKLINTNDKYVHTIDIRPRLSGTYYLKFVTNNTVLTRKVLIK